MRSSKYSLLTQYARVMFPVKDEERPIRYLFIAVHRIVAVQSLVSRSELLYARARRQGVGMKCRNNSLHSTKKYPSRFSHTRVWGEPQIKMVGNFWVLPRASLSRAAEAQVSFVKILRILPEIHSNFVRHPRTALDFVFTRHRNGLRNCRYGGGEIRTPERLAPLLVFETSAFVHSATPPKFSLRSHFE